MPLHPPDQHPTLFCCPGTTGAYDFNLIPNVGVALYPGLLFSAFVTSSTCTIIKFGQERIRMGG